MKIHELAKELNMDSKIVLEKAQSMGIDVHDNDSILKDMDAKAIKNLIQIGHKGGDTKIVKATPKKADAKTEEPKVTVKAANIPMPQQKTKKAAPAKQQEKHPTQKPPVGKPVVNKDLENRQKPPVGKPVVSKELEERTKAAEKAAEPKTEAPKAEPKKEAAKTADGKPVRQQGLKILKKAEDVREEERLAKEKREKAAAAKAAEKKTAEKPQRKDNREKRDGEGKGRDNRRDNNRGQRRDGDRPQRRDNNAQDRKPQQRRESQEVVAAEPMMEKPSTHKKGDKSKDKDKERNKFDRLERGGKKGGKPQPTRSLEKKERKKKPNKPKPAPEPEVEVIDLPEGTVMLNVPITVAGFAEQVRVSVSQIIMTLMKMGVMANMNQNLDLHQRWRTAQRLQPL